MIGLGREINRKSGVHDGLCGLTSSSVEPRRSHRDKYAGGARVRQVTSEGAGCKGSWALFMQ